MRRSIAALIGIACAAQVAIVPPASAGEGSTLSRSIDASVEMGEGVISVSSNAEFQVDGGWAAIEPQGADEELVYYSVARTNGRALAGVYRPAPVAHPAGSVIAPTTETELLRRAERLASTELTSAMNRSTSAETADVAVKSLSGFAASGGWAVVDEGNASQELFRYSGINESGGALVGVHRPRLIFHPAGSTVSAIAFSTEEVATNEPSDSSDAGTPPAEEEGATSTGEEPGTEQQTATGHSRNSDKAKKPDRSSNKHRMPQHPLQRVWQALGGAVEAALEQLWGAYGGDERSRRDRRDNSGQLRGKVRKSLCANELQVCAGANPYPYACSNSMEWCVETDPPTALCLPDLLAECLYPPDTEPLPVVSPGPNAGAVLFDQANLVRTEGQSGIQRFSVTGKEGLPLYPPGTSWTATVVGASGKFRISGTLGADGRGAIGYTGYFLGTDTITVSVAGSVGEATREFLPATVPPGKPQGFQATVVKGVGVDLSWQDVENERGYLIWHGSAGWGTFSSSWVTKPGATSWRMDPLGPGATACYRVQPKNRAGDGTMSDDMCVTAPLNDGPSGVTATALSSTEIRVTWNPVSYATYQYKIQRSPDGQSDWTQVGITSTGLDGSHPPTTFTDKNLEPLTRYHYRVISYNQIHSNPSAVASATTLSGPPPAPTDVRATGVSSSSMRVTWSDVSGETGYKIERSSTSGGIPVGDWKHIATVGVGITEHTDSGLAGGTMYLYRVRSVNQYGESAAVETTGVTGPGAPPVPTDVQGHGVDTTSTLIHWRDVDGEESYKIQRSPDGVSNWVQRGTSLANYPNFTDTGLTPNSGYYYRVIASNQHGDSGPSAAVYAATYGPPPVPTGVVASSISSSRVDVSWLDGKGETGYEVERASSSGGPWTSASALGENATAWADTGLAASTTYYYRVRALNPTYGHSGWSSAASATTTASTSPTAIDKPVISTSCSEGNSVATVSWHGYSSGRGSEGYIVDLDYAADGWTNDYHWSLWFDEGLGDAPNSASTWAPDSFSPEGARAAIGPSLTPGESYVVRVFYRTTAERSPDIAFVASSCSAAPAPAAPSGVTANAVNAYQVDVSWNETANADGYEVGRSSDQATWDVRPVDDAYFSDSDVKPATTYYYRVRALGDGAVSAWSATTSVSTPSYVPAEPRVSQFCIGTTEHAMVSWDRAPESASTVQIQVPEVFGTWTDGVHWERTTSVERDSVIAPDGFEPRGQSASLAFSPGSVYEVRVMQATHGAWSPPARFTSIDCSNPASQPNMPPPQGDYVITSNYASDIRSTRGWKVNWRVPSLTNPEHAWGATGQWYYNLESGIYRSPQGGWQVYYFGDDNGTDGNACPPSAEWRTGGVCGGDLGGFQAGEIVKFKYTYCDSTHKATVRGDRLCVYVDVPEDNITWRFLAEDARVNADGSAVKVEMYAHDIEVFDPQTHPHMRIPCTESVRMMRQEVKRLDGSWKVLTGNKWTLSDRTSEYKFYDKKLMATPASWGACDEA